MREVEVHSESPVRELRWSASAVTTFEQCPLKLWWGKVVGWQEGPSVATAAGSAVHAALEDLFRLPSGERHRAVADEALGHAIERERPVLASAQVPVDEVVAKAQAAMDVYWTMEDPTGIEVEGVERQVGPQLGDVPFVGYVDRIAVSDTGVRVTDYKTGSAKPRYFGPYFRQQYLYAAALRDADEPVTEIELLFLGDGRTVRRPVYEAALERAVANLVEVSESAAGMAERGTWEARQSPLCSWCSFEAVCPARRSRVPQPGSDQSNARIAEIPGMISRAERTAP